MENIVEQLDYLHLVQIVKLDIIVQEKLPLLLRLFAQQDITVPQEPIIQFTDHLGLTELRLEVLLYQIVLLVLLEIIVQILLQQLFQQLLVQLDMNVSLELELNILMI